MILRRPGPTSWYNWVTAPEGPAVPLLDHFHPPLFPRRHWESFHVTWAGAIADALNEDMLPDGYFAEEHAHFPDKYEVRVYEAEGGARLVAAIELVSPANKDRESHRAAF